MTYQKIRRAIVAPSFVPSTQEEQADRTERNLAQLSENYTRLAREVIDCHNQIQVYQLPALAAAASLAVVWSPPFYDALYSAFATPSWATTVSFSAQTRLGITFNFGTVVPGGGGTVLVMGIR